MPDMADRISNEEVHELWSEKQLVLFREMGVRDRLNAVKSGSLENWTDTTRAAAIDLLSDNETKPASSSTQKTFPFEHARHPLPLQVMRAARMDRFMIVASGGWTAVMIATAAHAYGLY